MSSCFIDFIEKAKRKRIDSKHKAKQSKLVKEKWLKKTILTVSHCSKLVINRRKQYETKNN